MHKSVITISLFLMGSLILLVSFANTNLFSNAMAQSYDTDSDSYYSTYPTDNNKYECQTGPLEGFFVSSVEFCKKVKFDKDESKRDSNRTGPPGSGNNNSTLVNTFNCINPNVININTESNQSSLSSLSGLQPIQDGVAQALNGTLDGLSLNKTIVNLCLINDNDNVVIVEGGNETEPTITCKECVAQVLNATAFANLELVLETIGIQVLVGATIVEINSLAELCDILDSVSGTVLVSVVQQVLRATAIIFPSEEFIELVTCIGTALGIIIPPIR